MQMDVLDEYRVSSRIEYKTKNVLIFYMRYDMFKHNVTLNIE